MKTVMIGEKRYHLPWLELIPFDPDQDAALGREIEEAGEVLVPVICNKTKSKANDVWVTDGAHRVLHCARLKLDAPPIKMRPFEDDEEELDFVLRVNLHRRHLTTQELEQQLRERNDRIIAKRREGESFQSIADSEGVSKTQVQRVLKESGGPGGTTCPKGGRVKGKDGKEYEAKPTLCKRCDRLWPNPVKNCKQCEAARKAKAKKKADAAKRKAEAANAEAKLDAFKNPVPKKLYDLLFDPWVQDGIDFLAQASEAFREERLGEVMTKKGKRNPFFKVDDFKDGCGFVIQYFDSLLEHMKEQRLAAVCPKCQGEGCGACKSCGLVPRSTYAELQK